jgi:hypothetical protein
VLATKEIGVRPVGDAGMGAHACDDGQHGKNSGPPCWRRGYCIVWEGREAWAGCRSSIARSIAVGGIVWYFFLTLVCKRATNVDKGY